MSEIRTEERTMYPRNNLNPDIDSDESGARKNIFGNLAVAGSLGKPDLLTEPES
jgi:hypothetical protein